MARKRQRLGAWVAGRAVAVPVLAAVLAAAVLAASAVLAAAADAPAPASGGEIYVRSSADLARALQKIAPGTVVTLGPGNYAGGHYVANRSGTAEAPIVIQGNDRRNPPVLSGGGEEAFHFSRCNFLTLRNLTVRGYRGNGINIDDGGKYDSPCHDLVVENVRFLDMGPRGNVDGLKLSGVDRLAVRQCRFEGWGGSAIDMVGCHHGVIEDCEFIGKEGFSGDTGPQMKGGSSDLLVQGCFFRNAGERAVNLGGSTDLEFFRPKAEDFEAKDITVAGNRFVGGEAPLAFVTASGGRVHHNTFYLPGKWLMRILQESNDPKFKPCHDGVFEDNLIVYDRRLGHTGEWVNDGPKTAPKTFQFRHNAWFAVDQARKPALPAPETDAVYQIDPKLDKPGTAEMKATSTDPKLKGIGADGYQRPKE